MHLPPRKGSLVKTVAIARDPHQWVEALKARSESSVLDAVIDLHGPVDQYGHLRCDGCDGATEFPADWPCQTMNLVGEQYGIPYMLPVIDGYVDLGYAPPDALEIRA